MLKIYNSDNSLDSEIYIEDIKGFSTNYSDLIIEIEQSKKIDGINEYKFNSKEDMTIFAQRFSKAKVFTSGAGQPIKRYKHIHKLPWLREFTEYDKKVFLYYKNEGTVIKGLIPEFGYCPQKYLIVSEKTKQILILSNDQILEESINFSEVINISSGFSCFIPMIIKYNKKGKIIKLSVIISSIKDCMAMRIAFFRHDHSQIKIKAEDKTVNRIMLPIFLMTFNMNRVGFQVPLNELFKKAEGSQLIILCFQEVPLLKRNSVLKSVEGYFKAQKFAVIAIYYMWEIALMVFSSEDLVPHISRVKCKNLSTGFMNIVGNKGGLMISFELMETKFAFIGVHLKHEAKNIQVRNSSLWKLFKTLRFGFDEMETQLQADYCFCLGDTNYRINHPWAELTKEIEANNLDNLLELDQLRHEKNSGRIFIEFEVNHLVN